MPTFKFYSTLFSHKWFPWRKVLAPRPEHYLVLYEIVLRLLPSHPFGCFGLRLDDWRRLLLATTTKFFLFFWLLLLPLFHFLWVFLTPTTAFCSYECLSTCALIFRLLWFNRTRSLRDFRGIHGRSCSRRRSRSTCTVGLSITDTDMWAHREGGTMLGWAALSAPERMCIGNWIYCLTFKVPLSQLRWKIGIKIFTSCLLHYASWCSGPTHPKVMQFTCWCGSPITYLSQMVYHPKHAHIYMYGKTNSSEMICWSVNCTNTSIRWALAVRALAQAT